jgi:hypothetical protein
MTDEEMLEFLDKLEEYSDTAYCKGPLYGAGYMCAIDFMRRKITENK